jgi:hypothetical protein
MRDFALNDKQMEIFLATWPNLGWAAKEREKQLLELSSKPLHEVSTSLPAGDLKAV